MDITDFFNNQTPSDYSASRLEKGEHVGELTWNAALHGPQLLADEDEREEARDYIRAFGAWSDEEIAAWSDVELNALVVQFVAGDIREAGLTPESTDEEWEDYYARSREGQCASTLYREDGRIYYCMDL